MFLSDIHLGIDARTNWCQRALHETMLAATLEWVIARGAAIEVELGCLAYPRLPSGGATPVR